MECASLARANGLIETDLSAQYRGYAARNATHHSVGLDMGNGVLILSPV